MKITTSPCLFCDIIHEKIPSQMVCQEESWVCFQDIHPAAPIHVLIVPKNHWPNLRSCYQTVAHEKMISLAQAPLVVAKYLQIHDFRLICNQGSGAGQEIDHLHWHLLAWPNTHPAPLVGKINP